MRCMLAWQGPEGARRGGLFIQQRCLHVSSMDAQGPGPGLHVPLLNAAAPPPAPPGSMLAIRLGESIVRITAPAVLGEGALLAVLADAPSLRPLTYRCGT